MNLVEDVSSNKRRYFLTGLKLVLGVFLMYSILSLQGSLDAEGCKYAVKMSGGVLP